RADDRALAVERPAERIDDAADHGVADGNLEEGAGGADLVPFDDLDVLAEDDDDDGVFFKVEDLAERLGAGELDHLAGHGGGEGVDARDAVAHLEDPADLARIELALVDLDLVSDY